jgi:hypothetical protein
MLLILPASWRLAGNDVTLGSSALSARLARKCIMPSLPSLSSDSLFPSTATAGSQENDASPAPKAGSSPFLSFGRACLFLNIRYLKPYAASFWAGSGYGGVWRGRRRGRECRWRRCRSWNARRPYARCRFRRPAAAPKNYCKRPPAAVPSGMQSLPRWSLIWWHRSLSVVYISLTIATCMEVQG